MSDHDSSPLLKRRSLLVSGLAGIGVAAVPVRSASAAAATATSNQPLTSQTTEGPYYFDPKLVRADITEGLSGVPLDIAFTVLDLAGRPVANARVDVWHCDAQGLYSGYSRQGEDGGTDLTGKTFLRGTQLANASGLVTFRSIYPGWYRGRTTHIHFKVISGTKTNLTSQFFLPDALSEFLYTQLPAYRRAQLRDTLNSNDGIAIEAGDTVEGTVREAQGRYIAALTLRVDPTANPSIDRPPVPGAGPGPGGAGGRPPGPPPGDRPNGMPPPGGPGMRGGPPRSAPLEGEARIQALVPKR
ncbi:intradiol ring-cleavage dioxygenase [Steroidobacter sp.]|uniref:intradiol ring-cleavage dioxygenase n=1 Tax=Steroidobacter sp. TaxID=1978227 RepID=UPI001A47FF6B|nr:intradiol ring-cleavage dioxygenase [Steroidobacter sp.]MBL8266572.1 intradiol ring-cleavage dioxygenase [Steroidobacter sp.]